MHRLTLNDIQCTEIRRIDLSVHHTRHRPRISVLNTSETTTLLGLRGNRELKICGIQVRVLLAVDPDLFSPPDAGPNRRKYPRQMLRMRTERRGLPSTPAHLS